MNTEATDALRAEFEAWAGKQGLDIDRQMFGHERRSYLEADTRAAWDVYRAGAARVGIARDDPALLDLLSLADSLRVYVHSQRAYTADYDLARERYYAAREQPSQVARNEMCKSATCRPGLICGSPEQCRQLGCADEALHAEEARNENSSAADRDNSQKRDAP